MKENRNRFNFNTNESEDNKPLSKRTAVLTHRKFNSQLDRNGAERYLSDGEIGDFIVRPSSDGEDYLAITWVFEKKIPGFQCTINNKDHFIYHCRIDPAQPSDDFITKSENPIQEIENFIEKMGPNFSEENKRKYVTTLEVLSQLST